MDTHSLSYDLLAGGDTPPGSGRMPNNLCDALGMRFEYPDSATGGDGPFTVRGTMPVDCRTCQPYGYISGGASLAFAETLAGYGSVLLLPKEEKPVGSMVSATHTASVAKGHTVTGTATILHKGRSTHLWNVDVTDENGRLISTARVLNHIVRIK